MVAKQPSTGLLDKYRPKIIFWLNIPAMFINPWYTVQTFLQGEYLLGALGLVLFLGIVIQNITIYIGKYSPYYTFCFTVPIVILTQSIGIPSLGILGVFWVYPIVLIFFFLLPRNLAVIANLCFLVAMSVVSLQTYDADVARRVIETLVVVILFTTIFVSIIERQQKKLEDKELMLRENVADASHELRTPLATTLAKVEAMKDGIRPADAAELASLSKSVDHLNSLVNDLHVLSLSDVSELVCLHEEVDLAHSILQALNASQEAFEQKALTVDLQIPESLRVEADPFRVRQILENLISNCARYTENNGTVTISSEVNDASTTITVADSGPGVDDDALGKLFQRFYRIDKSRSRQYGGSGMGLPLVKALAKAQKGNAWAEHSAAGGLSISFSLPNVS